MKILKFYYPDVKLKFRFGKCHDKTSFYLRWIHWVLLIKIKRKK